MSAQLQSKNEHLGQVNRQFFHLQSSAHQSQLFQSSEAYRDIPFSDMVVSHHPPATSESISMPYTSCGRSHISHHLDPHYTTGHQNSDGSISRAVKRPRTMSQQELSSQKMDRVTSNLSTRSAGPYTRNAPISPFFSLQTAGFQAELSGASNYLISGSYLTTHNFASQMQQITEDNGERLSMPGGTEPLSLASSVFVDPAAWLAAHDEPPLELGGLSPFPSTTQRRDTAASNPNMCASACGSMTSGATHENTAPLTRQNSRFDSNSVPGEVRMVNMCSQMSQDRDTYFPEPWQQHDIDYDTLSFVVKPPFCEDLIAIGSNLSSLSGYHSTVTVPGSDGLLVSSGMERSISSTSAVSAKSTSSLSARAKDTLKQQNHRALNAPLKPKPSADESKTDAPSDEKNDGKAVIAKTKYVRPRQPKVFCDICDEHKEGFRGEHELRRHKDAKHQTLVKKFICVDPNAIGIPANVQVINPLSKCKACNAKKKYGAYYNAAAHLRRTHFKEKPSRSKNKSPANGGDDDKRGGKGGGDWPSMHELKNWMREVLVQQDEQQPKEEEEEADDEIDNIQPFSDTEMDCGGAGNSPQSLVSAGLANIDYRFSNLLATNPINGGIPYTNASPLSSADFTFSSPPNIPLTFSTDMAMCSPVPNVVSSPTIVTPQIVFNHVPQHHFDLVNYQFAP